MSLLITFEPASTSRLPNLTRALVRAGAHPIYVGPEAPAIAGAQTVATEPRQRSILKAVLKAVSARRRRPPWIFVETDTRGSIALTTLSYLGSKTIFSFRGPTHSTGNLEPPRATAEASLLAVAARRAHTVFVETEELADYVLGRFGVREVEILSPGVDLSQLPLADRAEARAALGLPVTTRVVGWIGPVDDENLLRVVGLAHRRLAGVTLLVTGSGRAEGLLSALAAGARPSSPVLTVGPQDPATTVTTALASDVGLAWTASTARTILALGRRVVVPQRAVPHDPEPPYPEHRVVFPMDPTHEGVLSAVHEALDRDKNEPLSGDAVAMARQRLAEDHRLKTLAAYLLELG